MSIADEVRALRRSVGLSHPNHVAVVRVEGPDALDFLQHASTQSPYAREGRVRHTLLLNDDASVFADAFIVNVEDGFYVFAEGPTEAELVARFQERATQRPVSIRGTQEDWTTFGVDGPYAWELTASVLGPAVLGMPYLTLLRRDDIICIRAGKTGEYGYMMMVPRPKGAELEAKIREVGQAFDLMPVSVEALDICALENWHFSMRQIRKTDLVSPLTPIELQLQWRVVYTREFMGAEALRARRAEGVKMRVTCFTAEKPMSAGQRVQLGELDAGEVLAACASPTLGLTVGSVLLERRFAHPGLDLHASGNAMRTCTASLVNNLSLNVLPHKHSYATRETVL